MNNKKLNKIAEVVLTETNLTLEELQQPNRSEKRVMARMLFTALARAKGLSYPDIGNYLKKNHTTIIHSLKNLKKYPWVCDAFERYNNNITFNADLAAIRKIKISGRYGYLHAKYHGKCLICGFDEIIEVHHIIPRAKGGTDDEDNLVVLCPNHHALADKGMLEIKDIQKTLGYPQP